METTATVGEPTRITATELARNLSDVLNRVRYKGERFVVVRNGEEVARLEPGPEFRRMTLKEFVDAVRGGPKPDPEFLDDVIAIRASQGSLPPSPWDC
jgi:prevent-host-death family protein